MPNRDAKIAEPGAEAPLIQVRGIEQNKPLEARIQAGLARLMRADEVHTLRTVCCCIRPVGELVSGVIRIDDGQRHSWMKIEGSSVDAVATTIALSVESMEQGPRLEPGPVPECSACNCKNCPSGWPFERKHPQEADPTRYAALPSCCRR